MKYCIASSSAIALDQTRGPNPNLDLTRRMIHDVNSGVNRLATDLVKLHNDIARNPQSKRFTANNIKELALKLLKIIYGSIGFSSSGKIKACIFNDHTLHSQGLSQDISMRLPNLRDTDFTDDDGSLLVEKNK